MNALDEVAMISPTLIFYGPHPCDLCGKGPIIRGSVEQAFGNLRLDYPSEPIYPNHPWKEHVCTGSGHDPDCNCENCFAERRASGRPDPPYTKPDPELEKFIHDAKNLVTHSDPRWSAWLKDQVDADGIVGAGETEMDAIKSLADQYRALEEQEPRHQTGCICADCSGAELTSEND